MEDAGAIVELRDVVKTHQQGQSIVHALRGVTLTIRRGEFVSIVGPSGSGKSTLLHLTAGLDAPDAGQVVIDGRPLHSLSDDEVTLFRRRRIGFVFQFFNLLPTLTAESNVAMPLLLDGKPMREVRPRVEALLDRMGLRGRRTHRPDELSGGEMQRVAIARALVIEPAVLLADEPTGNLDSRTGDVVLSLLREIAADSGQTVVMVTHDERAARYGSRILTLKDGAVASDVPCARRAPARVSSLPYA